MNTKHLIKNAMAIKENTMAFKGKSKENKILSDYDFICYQLHSGKN